MKYCPKCQHQMNKDGHDSRSSRQMYKCKLCGHKTPNPLGFIADKKTGETDWREWSKHLQSGQDLHQKASRSQDKCEIKIETDSEYIIYQPMSDLHIGAIGCNYKQLEEFTNAILKVPDLYFSTCGDNTDNFNRFHNMLAIHQMQMSPEEQLKFFESWIEDTKHKFLFSTWGNHEEMEEKSSGVNSVKNILNRSLVYFNGIGVANLQVNEIEYTIAATHKTRFNSSFNKTHGLKQMARKELPNCDIYISGHTHDPAYEMSVERGTWQLFTVLGSMKSNDGYAKRYFTYWISNQMTAIVLNTRKKEFIPFLNLEQAFKYAGVKR